MVNYCFNKEEEEQIRQLNGQMVMKALAILNNDATANELSQQIVTFTGHPTKDVHHEVKRILDYGVATGFVMKIKNIYSLPCAYEIDSGRKYEEAEKLLENCITQLEASYPGFNYADYIQNRRSGDRAESSTSCDDSPTASVALDEECESRVDPLTYCSVHMSSEIEMDDPLVTIEVSSSSCDDSPDVALGEDCFGSSAPLGDTDDEVCDSDRGESGTDPLSTEVRTRSRGDARRIAELPGTKVDPVVHCVRDSSSEDEKDEKLLKLPKASAVIDELKKRRFEEKDDEGDGESSCKPSPKKKKRC